ncbi:helix-turn-helix domain-containing protein [Streptomyces sp. NPDC048270]|uniref:helix-turn-helix domain-containing protein n=1 Tax=Streptomyces sp. NPDC048270 TaxID=3154615 RepID=UPI00340BCA2D
MPKSTLETMRESVDALLALTGLQRQQLARAIDLPKYAVSRRQSGGSPWSFDEADAIARTFGISTLSLLAGPKEACDAYASHRGRTILELVSTRRKPTAATEAAQVTTPAAPVPPAPGG